MSSFTSFGQGIPVLGPNIGFPGAISRVGERVITARTVLSTATYNLNFGDPAVIIPDADGGTFRSVYDYIKAAAANAGFVASQFAGMAVREVKSEITYPVNQAPGVSVVGYYQPGAMAEVLERGSGTVQLAVGAPNTQDPVYTRAVLNGAIAAGTIGDWETNPAATDLFSYPVGTGGAAAGQAVVPIANTTNIQVGQVVTGQPGLPNGATVDSLVANTSVTLSGNLTQALAAGAELTFSNLIALPYVVARTGKVDANGMLEITLKVRNAA